MLRKPLQFTVAALLLLVVGFYLYSGRIEDRYRESATRYLDAALTDIGSWQPAALHQHLSTEARRAIGDEQLAGLVARYGDLGAFERLDDIQFARISVVMSLFAQQQLLSYSGEAHFQNGSAHLTATLTEHNGRFHLYNFNLSNPVPTTGRNNP